MPHGHLQKLHAQTVGKLRIEMDRVSPVSSMCAALVVGDPGDRSELRLVMKPDALSLCSFARF